MSDPIDGALSLFDDAEDDRSDAPPELAPPSPAVPVATGGRPGLTPSQAEAVRRRTGDLLLSAAAGSGKTRVLAERFAASVREDGVQPGRILAITFTEKAAAELAGRVREELGTEGPDAGWVGTVHSFCARLLRVHALDAGLDPSFTVLDEVGAARLEGRVFDSAVEAWMDAQGRPAERLTAAYTLGRLRDALLDVHAELRSRGKPVELPPWPDPTAAFASARTGLAAACAVAGAELSTGPGNGSVAAALGAVERCAGALAGPAEPLPGFLEVSGWAVKGRAKALSTEACESYETARERFAGALAELRAATDWPRLADLLARHAHGYEEAKRTRSVLDFADLEVRARDLLVARPSVRARWRQRFDRVMVDEFQDTNPLQLELLDLVAPEDLFAVGDAQQSIYGFRHADVRGFERRRDALAAHGAALTLADNFRTRPEVLDAVNAAFTGRLQSFAPLEAAREPGGDSGPRVELLLTDQGADWDAATLLAPGTVPDAPAWRLAESRLLAQRVSELVDAGTDPGDVVVLLRATGDLSTYQRALEDQGVPTYVIGGRGYWGRPEVQDLVAWLSVLANARDEERLYEVLASPMGGSSADGLVAIRETARETGAAPWVVVTETIQDPAAPGPLGLLDAAERERIGAFGAWAAAEREASAGLELEELIERAVERWDLDLGVLGRPGGRRRWANVRKLMRLSREWEQREGRDLRGFLDDVAYRSGVRAVESREAEAPVEGEGLDAVRLMTIHKAKGLEFDVVCVADLGRTRPGDSPVLRLGEDGSAGLRVAVIEDASSRATPGWEHLATERARREDQEELRLFYVAVTRARERLILSGAARFARWPKTVPAPGCAPMGWIGPAFVAGLAELAFASASGAAPRGVAELAGPTGTASVAWALNRPDTVGEVLRHECLAPEPAAAPPPPPRGGRPRAAPPLPPTGDRPRAAPPPAALSRPAPARPGASVPDRVSFTSLERYRACGYRFYAQYVLGLPPEEGDDPVGAAPGLSATTRGTLVHSALERLDLRDPGVDPAGLIDAAASGLGLALDPAARADAAALVTSFVGSSLHARLAAAPAVAREQPFSFVLEGLLVTGVLDAVAREGTGALVVDYKTNRLDGRDPARVVEADYAAQRTTYALALLGAGHERVEVAFGFLEDPARPVVAAFGPDDRAGLEAALGRLAAGVGAGRYEVTSEPNRDLCRGCPVRGTLCSHPREATLAEPPDRSVY